MAEEQETTGTTIVAGTVDTAAAPTFTKEQLAASQRYAHNPDVVYAVLKDGDAYTLEQADAAIQKFMEGEVQ